MSSLPHRIAVYFGLAEETAEDRHGRPPPPAPPLAHQLGASAFIAVVAGLVVRVLDRDVRSCVVFAALLAVVLIGQIFWRRRDKG
jgi:hypothetical protein